MLDPEIAAALTSGPLTDDKVVCRLLQVPTRTAHRMLDRGILQGVKLGAVRRFYTAPLRVLAGMEPTTAKAA